jgi:hypothetical protein
MLLADLVTAIRVELGSLEESQHGGVPGDIVDSFSVVCPAKQSTMSPIPLIIGKRRKSMAQGIKARRPNLLPSDTPKQGGAKRTGAPLLGGLLGGVHARKSCVQRRPGTKRGPRLEASLVGRCPELARGPVGRCRLSDERKAQRVGFGAFAGGGEEGALEAGGEGAGERVETNRCQICFRRG